MTYEIIINDEQRKLLMTACRIAIESWQGDTNELDMLAGMLEDAQTDDILVNNFTA